ncbi:MAG TPA: bestrophin family ion channel [Chitinophagaceae bacterium]|nr:bestrophin family ion channel [Chitinophagaceae bacterium]
MISYNPKEWFSYIFQFHKADTFRKLTPLLLAMSAYSGIIAFLELSYWNLSSNSYVKGIPAMHSLLGFAISMLLVFRTNTAYDRWWEGRKLWGMLVNNSRNLALKLSAILGEQDEQHRAFFKKVIPAYARALDHHLHKKKTQNELFDTGEAAAPAFGAIDHSRHVPNQMARMMYQHIQQLYTDKRITGEQLIYLNSELQSFTDICGACERIKNTPIPFSYSIFIKKFIFVYVMTLPFGYVFTLGYYVVPVVTFITYVLASLEIIAEEIEDPFGGDANDVPTDKIAETIHNNIQDIL